MLKIILLGLSWLAASSYGKTPREWAYHFQHGNFLEKTYQLIVTAILFLLLAYNLIELYHYFYPVQQQEVRAIKTQPQSTPSTTTHFLQTDIENEHKQLLSHETTLKTQLERFHPNTYQYYVSKDLDLLPLLKQGDSYCG